MTTSNNDDIEQRSVSMVSSLMVTAASSAPLVQPTEAVPSAERVEAFESALARQQDATAASEAGAAGQVGGVSEVSVADVDPQSLARRGLGLDGVDPAAQAPVAGAERGDMILDGIQRLRGVFDARETSIGDALKSGPLDANSMMSLQMEVTNFTLLVDLTSKLTGKSTQAFETLMKGQ